ncbi:MAG: ribokinase [Rhodobacteraceae bacterium]|nr:MAG: ribokinase [Paracoccaceae bacterium]
MTRPRRLLQMQGVVLDLVYEVEAIPASGEEAVVTGFARAPGGGFNAMAAARRSGLPATCGCRVGTGPFADVVAEGLAAEGIDTALPRLPDRDQGVCVVLVEPSGERSFVHHDGAESRIADADLAALDLAAFGWTILSGYMLHYPAGRDALARWLWREAAIPCLLFDPSPLAAALPAEALRAALGRAAWVSANVAEAAALTGLADPAEAAARLADGRPTDGGAVVRAGAAGCVVAAGGRVTPVPGFAVDPVDTTGAGDAHLGAFVAALADGAEPVAAARYANVAAALSTTRRGPATAPDRQTIERAMRETTDGANAG